MDQKIDVLIVEPGKEPRLTTVADDLEHHLRNLLTVQFRGGTLRFPLSCPADAVPGVFRPAWFGRRQRPVTVPHLIHRLAVPP